MLGVCTWESHVIQQRLLERVKPPSEVMHVQHLAFNNIGSA